ncbi:WD repeat-containing protein 74 [Auxenochlorella protothecoides]|uniref:WD repeat-containing protein 74 n=1 Tax=Auxenochlorella protothecoides TaxID=3075 RepID=A0A087SLF6_AUXPR|nr:WD repeat-containing protein 74 [Auxenochlorella protothecoides]KFM26560.1 WD repeat-containing protein 74 [Auxenochlorella protothecoides]
MTDVKSSPPLRVLVSDELGQVKVVDVAAQYATAARSATWGTVSAARAITSLASLPGEGTRPDALLVGQADGEVSCLQGLNGEAAAPLQPAASGSGEGVRSVHVVPGSGEPTIVTVSAGGCVRGFARQPDDGAWAEAWRWQAACKEVECSGVDPTGRLLAVGGRGCELRLHALADGGVAFAGRGGKPSREEPAGARLVVGTGHHRVRLYDTAAGRRPQLDVGWGEARITALASEPSGTRCWVANGQGQIAVLELPSGLVVGGIKGAAGSVKALTLHPTLPILASAGLDRTLRLHHTASRKLLAKVFLKSQLTGGRSTSSLGD